MVGFDLALILCCKEKAFLSFEFVLFCCMRRYGGDSFEEALQFVAGKRSEGEPVSLVSVFDRFGLPGCVDENVFERVYRGRGLPVLDVQDFICFYGDELEKGMVLEAVAELFGVSKGSVSVAAGRVVEGLTGLEDGVESSGLRRESFGVYTGERSVKGFALFLAGKCSESGVRHCFSSRVWAAGLVFVAAKVI
jgi:hypothetical protein